MEKHNEAKNTQHISMPITSILAHPNVFFNLFSCCLPWHVTIALALSEHTDGSTIDARTLSGVFVSSGVPFLFSIVAWASLPY